MQLGPGGKNETIVSALGKLDLFKPVVKPFIVEKLIFILSSGEDLT